VSTKRRFCTVPNIPFFRDWYVKRYNSACERHDHEYAIYQDRFGYSFTTLRLRFESDVDYIFHILRIYDKSPILARIGHGLFGILHMPFFMANNLVYTIKIIINKIKGG
jgi:hypothetical protein